MGKTAYHSKLQYGWAAQRSVTHDGGTAWGWPAWQRHAGKHVHGDIPSLVGWCMPCYGECRRRGRKQRFWPSKLVDCGHIACRLPLVNLTITMTKMNSCAGKQELLNQRFCGTLGSAQHIVGGDEGPIKLGQKRET